MALSNQRLSRLIGSAQAAITWERLWPAMAPMVGVVAVFAATAWMGLWIGVPPIAKAVGLGVFAVAFVLAAWRLTRLVLPDRGEAMRRLETDAGLEHRPLNAYEDTLAVGEDEFSQSLWRVHQMRAAERLAALKTTMPQADLVPHDPYAVRSAVGMVLFIGILVGAGALAERLITPFDFTNPVETAAGPQFRLDAWVTPPAYTGRAPLFLSSATRVDTQDGIAVPAGSLLTVRGQGDASGMSLSIEEGGETRSAEMPAISGSDGVAAHEATVAIEGDIFVEVQKGGSPLEGWRFSAAGDAAPTVSVVESPRANERDGFEVGYELNDDYGIASAKGTLAPVGAPDDRRPLVGDPEFALTLPGGPGLRGAARTVHDLSSHPYAGREVTLQLEATDGAGQTGSSDEQTFRLPGRTFTNPMARAIVEQRAELAMDARAHLRVIDAMDLLLLTPSDVGDAGAFLAVDAAYRDLVDAETDDELTEMLDVLWDLALMLEDDGVSDARRALEAAQERLRQALEDGASEEEIARLTRELREAMQRYMQALAERMENMAQGEMDPNAREITQGDLDDMLKRIEELAKEGRHAEAEALLSELQQMMENLQMAQRGQGQGDPMGQEGRALDELGKMIQRQQELMDETYGMGEGEQPGEGRMGEGQRPGEQGMGQQGQRPGGQGQGQQGQQGQGGEGRQQALERLSREQAELRQQLEDLMRQLEEQGFEPGERLGDAGEEMGEAGEALGQNQPGQALGDQEQALEALREGAQGMAQQMAEARQEGEGQGLGPPQDGPGRDPLGRTRREGSYADTSRVEVPDEIDTQRARRILQELRERLGDMNLPRIERDYLERLLP